MKAAYDSMVQSNKEAAQILGMFECSACTDITGFGLMGHLLEMIKFDDDSESDNLNDDRIVKIAVELSIKSVPMLYGAIDCIKEGVFSSLHPQNIRCSRAVGNLALAEGNHAYPLLYDPQVSHVIHTCLYIHKCKRFDDWYTTTCNYQNSLYFSMHSDIWWTFSSSTISFSLRTSGSTEGGGI